ncbi:MAG: single-stranded-DNA-specific exonuclease RecJ [Patescibacteria group bacterium]|nr:single-stranded-DNA-specific exonuclease RecJ [Patescibacteria group bacterium]
MKRRWQIKPKVPPEFATKFPDEHPVILQLLYNRNIMSPQQADAFFRPRYEKLGSPFVLSGMVAAVERILRAVDKHEKIVVYADYDADAVTACTVLYRALRAFGAEVSSYIPDRFSEGYGVNLDAVKQIAESGAKLIVTVDCGINAVSETALAKNLGMDVVITDHHEIIGALPQASAVVNPKLDPELSELSGLTGVGVAFKLATALFAAVRPGDYSKFYGWDIPAAAEKAGISLGKILTVPFAWEKWFLDLVAIGTVADCQSLLGENRTLVKFGLRVLSKTKWPGLRQLMRNAGLSEKKDFETFDIGFILAPRINAAGRIQHADIAFRLLASDDPAEVSMYAGQLESLNAHRQRLTEQITAEARALVLEQVDGKLLFAVGENWPKGVVGLVASRLSDEFSRPAVVLERGVTHATGSARSVGGF